MAMHQRMEGVTGSTGGGCPGRDTSFLIKMAQVCPGGTILNLLVGYAGVAAAGLRHMAL